MKACGASYCHFIRRGKLYKCPIAGLIYKYNEYFDVNYFPDDDGISVDDEKFIDKVRKINEPIKLCRFCAEKPVMFPWKVSTKPMQDEWMR